MLRCQFAGDWGVAIEDGAEVAMIAIVSGHCVLRPAADEAASDSADESDGDRQRRQPIELAPGDVAVVTGGRRYVFAGDHHTEPTVVIEPGSRCRDLAGNDLAMSMGLGVRTWGTPGRPDTVYLSATWEHPGQVTGRLLDAVDEVIVVRAADTEDAVLDLLLAESQRDLPGQDVVVDRLVDLTLVSVLRRWFATNPAAAPAWWRAHDDPLVAQAMALLHDAPEHDWTLGGLAAAVHVSRATLARRFRDVTGVPVMSYLSAWRLDLAADRLRTGGDSIGVIAAAVGYENPFAFTNAFKRRYGASPTAFRAAG